jgi:hypothetical protein
MLRLVEILVMVPLDYLLAVALLATPSESLDLNGTSERFVTVRPTVQSLAIAWEILDEREVRYVLMRSDDFSGDLKLLRRRYQELADAPLLHDEMRFPDRALINDLLSFNRSYRQHLDNRQSMELTYWWELREMLQEVDRLYTIWDTVRDARCDYYYITVRRQALKKLKEMVGEVAYNNGCLPPHVPIWRFARID